MTRHSRMIGWAGILSAGALVSATARPRAHACDGVADRI